MLELSAPLNVCCAHEEGATRVGRPFFVKQRYGQVVPFLRPLLPALQAEAPDTVGVTVTQ